MAILINPFTGQLDYTGNGGGGGGGGPTFNVDYFTLSPTDISNKFVTLINTPQVSADVLVTPVDGILQQYSVDYTVSGNTLSWNGLGLEPLLESGDILIVNYTSA